MLSLTDAQKTQLQPHFDAVQLQFDAAVTRFGDLSPDDHMPERIGD